MRIRFLLVAALLAPVFSYAAGTTVLTSDQATRLAQDAVKVANSQGYKVSATVVDANGAIIATVRGDGANPATPKTTFKKPPTALALKENTSVFLARINGGDPSILNKFVLSTLGSTQDNIILLGGGILIKNEGVIIGAIGVGGAPGGHLDDAIAMEALKNAGLKDN